MSSSDQRLTNTNSNSTTTLDATYFTCPRCDCQQQPCKTEDKAVATTPTTDATSSIFSYPNDPLTTLVCASSDRGQSQSQNHAPQVEEARVCPMCEASFPPEMTQAEFEAHVIAHFEGDVESLIGQFEDLGLSIEAREAGGTMFDIRS